MERHDRTRPERMIFRVSKSERRSIEEASEEEGRTPSDFIRRALLLTITETLKQGVE